MAANTLVSSVRYGLEDLYRTDFALYYVFSRTGLDYGWSHLYDLQAQAAVYEALGPIWYFPLPYTPPMAWLTAPLTVLPLPVGYWIWSVLMAGCLLGAWWLASPKESLLRALCLTAALSPYLTLLGLEMGQVIPLQLLSVAAAYRLAGAGREWLAGLALIGIALHPQAYFLVPVAFLVTGHRRLLVTFSGAALLLVVASMFALGPRGVLAFLDRLRMADANPLQFYVAFSIDLPLMFHSHHRLAAIMQATICGFAVVGMWRVRRDGLERALAIALIASTLITSFIHLDDLMVLALAAWLVLRRRPHPAVAAVMSAAFLVSLGMDFAGADRWGHLLVLLDILWLGGLVLLPPAPPRPNPLGLPELAPDAAAVTPAGGSLGPASAGVPPATRV